MSGGVALVWAAAASGRVIASLALVGLARRALRKAAVAGTTDLAPHKSFSGDRHGSSTCRLGKVVFTMSFRGL
jgi:hypothetical protein